MPINRDQSITDNLSPSGRVPSIADQGNVFGAGAGARMSHTEERDACNFSTAVQRSKAGDPYGPYSATPWDPAAHVASHAERKHTGGVGGSAFNRGDVLVQPPNDGPKR
jgi:hypothetical protein